MPMPGTVRYKGILGEPDTKTPIKLFGNFPYAAAHFETVKFEGHYHDFGKLLASLERDYPYMQFQLRTIGVLTPERPETKYYLDFVLRVIALVRKPVGK
jgi:hypothetical protein